ncbi:sterile alpha motif domain-containing protein 3 isoform X2 [Rhineura floridana]|uniref:sterile alpha motif domain-containing protein 3 isoform X2 n=1 Tax=Rhineura floridana TaxID=261503 RepID=UPI002AC80CAB|nr:sterile alpha motif domain-containing protein 3 isoform X2 [Rhineura floridana]
MPRIAPGPSACQAVYSGIYCHSMRKMESWSVDQVCSWLLQKNLGDLVPKFREEEVSGAALLALNERMVQQLVKKIGHQAVLMDLIKKCKQQTEGSAFICEMPFSESPGEFSGTSGIQLHVEQVNCFSPNENPDDGAIDQRVLKQKKTMRHVLARCKALEWTNSYILPEFPYDVKCILAEGKCPDHSVRIRIIEFLQADMTKYLEGSLYPTTQQYNDVVNALLQAYPFLDEDGSGFFLWKRALKDRFKYVRRPIDDDEQVVRNKCKFGHRRGQTRKSPGSRCEEVQGGHTKVENIYNEALDTEINEHINWFKEEYMKTERNWAEVDNRMTKTLEIRRKMINNQRKPLKEILRLFPFLRCPYQLFKEFHFLTRKDIYKKTAEILEAYSENILTSCVVKNSPINVVLQKNLKQHMEDDIRTYMKMTATCLLLPDVFGEDSYLFAAVNEEVKVSTPVLEVKYPFNVNVCECSLYVEKEKLAQLDDCTMALAALLASYHVFGIQYPKGLYNTLRFLESLIFEVKYPQLLSAKNKKTGKM